MQRERGPFNLKLDGEPSHGTVLTGWECSLGDWKINQAISYIEALQLFHTHNLMHRPGTATLKPVKILKNVNEINLNEKLPRIRDKSSK